MTIKIDKPNILDVVQREGIEIRQCGRNFVGLCPFHTEKTPSFVVNLERQRWKCFGCGQSGDVISFIQRRKRLSFTGALQYLGNSTGEPIRETLQDAKRRKIVKKFREWCANYSKWLCEMLRLCNRIDSLVTTSEHLEFAGLEAMYLMRDIYQWHLSVLNGGNDKLKFELYEDFRNGRG